MSPALHAAPPARQQIQVTRTFDAPRRLVFDALTRPELLRRWFGPRRWEVLVCEVDLREGGAWRFVFCRPDGLRIRCRGLYHQVITPQRLVYTEAIDGFQATPGGNESLVTTTLVERHHRTTLTTTVLLPADQPSIVSSALTLSGAPPTSSPSVLRRSIPR